MIAKEDKELYDIAKTYFARQQEDRDCRYYDHCFLRAAQLDAICVPCAECNGRGMPRKEKFRLANFQGYLSAKQKAEYVKVINKFLKEYLRLGLYHEYK